MLNFQTTYWNTIIKISDLQQDLMKTLNKYVNLIPVKAVDENFTPTYNNLLKQLVDWPKDIFPIPPAAWVNPRTGTISAQKDIWHYVFHGNGVTFTKEIGEEEIGVEFGVKGELALTPWIVYTYIESITSIKMPEKAHLMDNNNTLFYELVNNGKLIPVPPRLPGSDQTFVLQLMS